MLPGMDDLQLSVNPIYILVLKFVTFSFVVIGQQA